jgi:DNA modification methylase
MHMPFDSVGSPAIRAASVVRSSIYCGDAARTMRRMRPASIDAIITSPPYAQQRAAQYGGVAESDYPEWTATWMAAARPLLKPGGTVAIVIRPHVERGRLSDYVLRTILTLRERGWYHHDDLVWHKTTSGPLGRPDWPRRAYEMIHWFGLSPKPFCDPRANGRPSHDIGFRLRGSKGVGDLWTSSGTSTTGIARSTDVIAAGVHGCARGNQHPAQFPLPLAEHLVRLLAPRGGTVLDPFVGSGTTVEAAVRAERHGIGIDQNREYAAFARRRVAQAANDAEPVARRPDRAA